ncbi:TPA: hypothetical protein DCE37_02200 [Candidatus Latescibacteria bacterium]|nr:hypothetical protein [Candidatus Latescibacterota bacterium]
MLNVEPKTRAILLNRILFAFRSWPILDLHLGPFFTPVAFLPHEPRVVDVEVPPDSVGTGIELDQVGFTRVVEPEPSVSLCVIRRSGASQLGID